MPQVDATYEIAIDSDADELYEGGAEDVSSDVLDRVGLRTSRGRDQLRDTAPPRAGRSDFTLRNDAGTYDVGNAVGEGDGVRLRITDPTTSTVHDTWRGILDELQQQPRSSGMERAAVRALGTLSRLGGGRSGLSTALFESLTADVALGHLLDAADWPKTLPEYIKNDLDNVAGFWPMGEASGDALDGSANSNDGTVTAAGARDATALDDGGDGCIEWNATTTKVEIADDAAIQNIWDGGGWAFGIFNADSDGEGSQGRILDKVAWSVRISSEAGGLVRIDFHYDFDGAADGHWHSAVDIPINTIVGWAINYDADDPDNNPTFYIIHGTTISTLTVGSGLTEATTPSGGSTRVTDVGSALVIGNNTGQTATFDGHIDEVAVGTDTLTAAETAILRARVQDAPRHLDTAKQTLESWWLDEGERVFGAMNNLLATEGPGSVIYEDGTGAIVFKNRHARATESRSTSIQTTFAGTGNITVLANGLEHNDGRRAIINVASMLRRGRTAAASAAIWVLGETITLGGSETKKITIRQASRVPFKTALDPVVTTDYTIDSGGLSSITLDRTSGSSAVLTIVAGAAGVTLSALQVRAQSFDIDGTGEGTVVESVIDASASITKFGKRPLPARIKPRAEISLIDAQELINAYVAFHKDARPTARFAVNANRHGDAMTACLAREVSDRVRLNVASVDINAYVEEVHQRVGPGAIQWTTFGVEEATAAGPFILDTSTMDGPDVLWFGIAGLLAAGLSLIGALTSISGAVA